MPDESSAPSPESFTGSQLPAADSVAPPPPPLPPAGGPPPPYAYAPAYGSYAPRATYGAYMQPPKKRRSPWFWAAIFGGSALVIVLLITAMIWSIVNNVSGDTTAGINGFSS